MERLDKAVKELQGLMKLTGKIEKQQYIEDRKDDGDFLALLYYRLNPYHAYKIKKFDIYRMREKSLTFDAFIDHLNVLRRSNINDALRQHTMDLLATADHTYVGILEGIITKGLSVGVDTAVNKALGYMYIPTFSCMLAAPLKEGDEISMPAIVELKLDGVRCIGRVAEEKCTLLTRQGRELNFPKIEKELVRLANGEELTFDGELITEKRTDISGICNRNLKSGYTPGSDDYIELTLFDVIPTAVFDVLGKSKPQQDRTIELQSRMMNFKSKRITQAPSFTVNSMAEVQKINNEYIAAGYEGTIVKDIGAIYHYKRNKAWRKLKAVNSCTLRIVGTEEGKGKRKDKVGAVLCESSCGGIKVKVGSGFSDALIEVMTNKSDPTGKLVEVIFNVLIKGEDSDTYSLFLPRFDQFRIDLDEADSLAKVKDQHVGKIEE